MESRKYSQTATFMTILTNPFILNGHADI